MEQVKMVDSHWMSQERFSPNMLAFEIKVRINDAMEANGLERAWWRAFDNDDQDVDIFEKVYGIIIDPISEESERQANMKAYYGRVRIKVDAYIKKRLELIRSLEIHE